MQKFSCNSDKIFISKANAYFGGSLCLPDALFPKQISAL
jgi:hypothetical protein